MASVSSQCRFCGFHNPRSWRACASCGRSLGGTIRATDVTSVTQFETTQVTSFEEGTAEARLAAERTKEAAEKAREVAIQEEEDDPSGREPPLIGQLDASNAIRAGIENSKTNNKPTLVALEGVRGSGKTRLLVHASELAAAVDPTTNVAYGVCRGEGDGPYSPISRVLLERFGVTPSSSPTVVRAGIGTQVSRALDTKDVVRITETTHLLGHIAGIPFPHSAVLTKLAESPTELHRAACQAIRRFIEAEASKRPVLLLLDDMHFAERTAWDLVQAILEAKGPIAVVIAGDNPVSERAATLKAIGGMAVGPIAPLEENEVRTMLHVLLPNLLSTPDALVSATTHRSEGNASKIREIAYSLWETGLVKATPEGLEVDLDRLKSGDELPIDFKDALRGRLSRLDALERRTLDRAALVGNRFWDGAILAQMRSDRPAPGDATNPMTIWPEDDDAAALQQTLFRLEQKGFVQSLDASDMPASQEYTFALEGTRELLQSELEDESRVRRHTAVASWMGVIGEFQREGIAARIAPHLEAAGQLGRAGRAYLEAAADERFHRRIERALRFATRALEMVPPEDSVRRIAALHEAGSLLAQLGHYDESIEKFTEMLQQAWRVGARGKGGAALNRIARIHRARGENDQAEELFERALELFRAGNDLRGVASTLDDLAQIYKQKGQLDQGFVRAEGALEIRRSHGDRRGEAVSLNTLGELERLRGRLDIAENHLQSSFAIRESLGEQEGMLQCLNQLAIVAYERGDQPAAVESWRSALERAREIADRRRECHLLNNIGEALCTNSDFDGAETHLQEALGLAMEMEDLRTIAEVKRNLGVLAAQRGDADGASQLKEALEAAERYGGPNLIALAHRALAEAFGRTVIADGKVDNRGQSHFEKAIEFFSEIGNEREIAKTEWLLGNYLLQRQRNAEAKEHYLAARALFRRRGDVEEAHRIDERLSEIG